jgi:flagellar biosynthesis/type III secretory pathway protein FliH
MTWSSDVTSPGKPPTNHLAAVQWNPDELELDGEPFGGTGISRASQSAARATEAAHLVHQQALDDAFTQGFDAGREAGATAERARLEAPLAAVTSLLEELREREALWAERMEENLCALAVAVGRQLFDAELQAAPAHAATLVRRALTEFPIDQPVTIRVNPSDLASITALAVVDGGQTPVARPDAQWVPDPRMTPGGCVVEGRDRIVDGRVDTALERVYRRLTGTGA